jgi:hypothetical protein
MKGGLGFAMTFTACATLAVAAGLARAEDAANKAEPYTPGLGDFMTAYVQPHHTKLFLAVQAGNWPLAEYEAKELRETFEDVATYQAIWHDFPIAKLLEANMTPALDAVDAAIAAHDAARTRAAAEKLSAACNSCHQATGNDFMVIKTPTASAFPDQEFKPR